MIIISGGLNLPDYFSNKQNLIITTQYWFLVFLYLIYCCGFKVF